MKKDGLQLGKLYLIAKESSRKEYKHQDVLVVFHRILINAMACLKP